MSLNRDESPATFLEWLMEAFHQDTPYDLSSEKHKATVTMAFTDHTSRDIRKKLQRLEGLQGKSLTDLVQAAEKVYHNRETVEEEQREKEDDREIQKEMQ